MLRINYIIILISMLTMGICAQSASVLAKSTTAQSAAGLLASYNVSNSLISSLIYTNISVNGDTYQLAYSAGNPVFLINSTAGSYSIILNSTQIASIIGPSIVAHSISQINSTYLTKSMQSYNSSASAIVADCAVEVGLGGGSTCTYANNCASCLSSPVCSAALVGSVRLGASGAGYGSPFEYGVIDFVSQYFALESNLTTYYASTSINPANAQTGIGRLIGAFNNISNATQAMYQDPIFVPSGNLDYSQCPADGVGGPAYCYATPICGTPYGGGLSYNLTLLNNMQAYLNYIESLPITAPQIATVAANITTSENIYVAPLITKAKLAQVKVIENTTLSGYNRSIASATSLLTHISNTLLSIQLATIQANYSALTTNYDSANLTALNKTLAKEYSSLKLNYAGLNATYSSSLDLAANNTITLIELQLGNSNPSPKLTALSFRQSELNSQLGASINNLTALNNQLRNVSVQAKTISNNPSLTQSLARSIDAPVATGILSAMGSTYSNSLQLAPALSLIPALIVGILVIAAILLYRNSLAKKHRIALNSKTRENWSRLFILLVILVVVVLIVTYVVASAANQSAPISAFVAAVHSSNSAVIALNGTNNTAMVSCAYSIKSALTAINKTSKIITMGGIACNNGVPLETVDKCLASYAASGTPVIILTNSSEDSISSYSYYGSVLGVSGSPQFMSTCIASTIIR